MDVALYHPTDGYYANTSAIGADGDYFTSPVAHPAFAALIAVQLRELWRALGSPSRFHAVEIGAGSGLLGRDLVGYAKAMPGGFGEALEYVALDRSAPPFVQDLTPTGSHRLVTDGVPLRGIVGCVLTNELLDAFPVNRFRVRDGDLLEVYVAVRNETLIEVLDTPSTPALAKRLDGRRLALAEGYEGEANLRIGRWMTQVAQALETGFVLTIDYGYTAEELYAPERARGTLQTHYKHTTGGSLYQRIGRQDITAHVDFSAAMSQGTAVGLRTVGLVTQSEFLHRLGFERLLSTVGERKMPAREKSANVMAMRELVKPDGLGRFKVLVQERSTGVSDLDESKCQDDLPEAPLLQPPHIPLAEGRYPHTAWEVEELWPLDGNAGGPPAT